MTHRILLPLLYTLAAAFLALPAAQAHKPAAQGHSPAHSHGASAHAHVHGQLELDVAIEGPAISIELRSPLDNLIGFERAPRTEVEKNTVDQTLALLRAADQLFRIDPAAGCKLGPVTLQAPVLGLGGAPAPANAPAGAAGADEHADLHGRFAFNCTSAEQAKYIELDFFKAFKNARQIDAQIVTAKGQYKRSLKRPASRLSWAP